MSWKMFWQIVLLIVIAALVTSVLKCSILSYKYGWCKGKYSQELPHQRGHDPPGQLLCAFDQFQEPGGGLSFRAESLRDNGEQSAQAQGNIQSQGIPVQP